MKIVDSQGRLFGRINLFDAVVISICLLGLIALYTALFVPERVSRIITGELIFKEAVVVVAIPKDLEWLDGSIKPGDRQKGRYGETIAEIVAKDWHVFGQNRFLTVSCKVRARVEVDGTLVFCGRIIRRGEGFTFANENIRIAGYVLDAGNGQTDKR